MNLTADLFRKLSRQTVIVPQEKAVVPGPAPVKFNLVQRPLIFGLILIGLAYASSLPEQINAANNLKQLKSQAREALPKELIDRDLKSLRGKIGEGKKKLALIKDLAASRMYITPYFNLLPRSVKDGLWIESLDISLKDKSPALHMKGASSLGDEGSDSAAVKDFLAALKDSRDLLAGLNDLELVSLRKDNSGAHKITVFEIASPVGAAMTMIKTACSY